MVKLIFLFSFFQELFCVVQLKNSVTHFIYLFNRLCVAFPSSKSHSYYMVQKASFNFFKVRQYCLWSISSVMVDDKKLGRSKNKNYRKCYTSLQFLLEYHPLLTIWTLKVSQILSKNIHFGCCFSKS